MLLLTDVVVRIWPASLALLFLQAEAASKGLTEGEVLQQAVLREAVMYGEMVQAVYDTLLTNDLYSPYFGNCVPGLMQVDEKLGNTVQNYTQLGEDAKQYTVRQCIDNMLLHCTKTKLQQAWVCHRARP